LALAGDGTVWAWGNNYAGQLGDGATSSRTMPVQARGLTAASTIAAGYSHTVARTTGGEVWSWGDNASGQLGDGTTTRRYAPQQVAGIAEATAVAAGSAFTLALKNDGSVLSWGDNWAGQLGNGTTVTGTAPAAVADLMDVTAITAGGDHGVALASDGTVWTWGSNSFGQLGDSTTTNSATPFLVYDLETVYLQSVSAIAAGDAFTLALKADGTVWAWGSNGAGQLGDGTTTDSSFPVRVSGLTNITAIAAGGFHALAMNADGTVWAWGDNSYGQLGNGTYTGSSLPVQLTTGSGVTAIAAGLLHSSVRLQDGTLLAWGENSAGQLGDGSVTQRPMPVTAGAGTVSAIAAGAYHTAAVAADGTVFAWGWDGHGQLGDNYNTTLPLPALLQLPPARPAIMAAPATVNTGNAPLGTTTSPLPITLSNTGTADLTVSGIILTGSTPNQFTVSTGSCASLTPTIAPGDSCTVYVTFTPFVLGPKSAILRITSNDETTTTLDLPLSGTGVIPFYALTVTVLGPGSGRVDAVPGGPCSDSCSQSLAQNTLVQLTAVAANGSVFSGWTGCDTTNGASCSVTMGSAQNVVALFTPDQNGAIPVMALAPASADFGMVATYASSATRVLTITNSGDGTLYVIRAALDGGDSSQFSLQPGSCPSLTPAIAPGNSCTLLATFVPTTVGSKSATLQVTATDPAHPLQTVSLAGTAYDPPPMGILTINGGAAFTTNAAVTLGLTALDNSGTVAQMRFSNTNTTWSSWELYAPAREWSLSALGGDGAKTVYVQFMDGAGNASGSFAASITLDTTAPVTTITAMPGPLSPASSGSFSFAATESATFRCSMDTGPWADCTSPYPFSGLTEGSHTFSVRATDRAGNAETAPPSYTFTIDTTAPETTISDQPAPLVATTSASFIFGSADTTAIYHCKLDTGTWSRCYSPFIAGNLGEGSHTFSVKAIDWAGNMDLTPATATWTVDITPPETTLTGSTSGTSATFAVGSPDPTATLQCRLDDGLWSACSGTITLTALTNGSHVFSVVATDPAGNADPTPAGYSWTAGSVVQIAGGSGFATIGEAIAAAPDGAILRFRAMSFTETVTVTSGKALTFSGGYGENFVAPTQGEMTTLAGLTVVAGSLTVENLVIQ
jgi:alpha-tubulin suppressor-like RCC1 family protein